jgi:Lon protease-like protein
MNLFQERTETQALTKNPAKIFIFPLGVVLLPEMIMPLHIFEARYKDMVNGCLKRNEFFGIVYFDGKQIHKVGCTANIVKVVKQYEDGRMDIVVQGVRRFYMDHIDESQACLVSTIIYIDDMEESLNDEDQALIHRATDLLKHLGRLSGQSGENDRLDDMDLMHLSFLVPGAEGFTMDERQRFLEMTSARERLDKGTRVLGKVIERVKINREASEIIGGNGHLRVFLAGRGLIP